MIYRVGHPQTAAVVTEYKEAMDFRERELLPQVDKTSTLFIAFASRFGNPEFRSLAISTDKLHLTLPDDVHCESHDLTQAKCQDSHRPEVRTLVRRIRTRSVASSERSGWRRCSSSRTTKKKHESENHALEAEFAMAI